MKFVHVCTFRTLPPSFDVVHDGMDQMKAYRYYSYGNLRFSTRFQTLGTTGFCIPTLHNCISKICVTAFIFNSTSNVHLDTPSSMIMVWLMSQKQFEKLHQEEIEIRGEHLAASTFCVPSRRLGCHWKESMSARCSSVRRYLQCN